MTAAERWRLGWQVLYWLWIATETAVALLTRTRRGGGEVQDRGSMVLLWVVIAGSITAGTWFGETHAHTLAGGAPWVRTLSVVVFAAGLMTRWTAIASLGRTFSANVAIRSAQTVYRKGLYSVVRHPSYTGLLMIFLALGLRTRNWVGLLLVVLPTTAALLYRIHVEEAALLRAFGAEYAEYSGATKRLIPGVY